MYFMSGQQTQHYVDGLVQERHNSIPKALELVFLALTLAYLWLNWIDQGKRDMTSLVNHWSYVPLALTSRIEVIKNQTLYCVGPGLFQASYYML